jgi:WD40 repeat protein
MKSFLPLAILILLLAGCAAATPAPAATASPQPSQTATASQTPRIMPTASPSATPTITPSPEPSATSTPALPLAPGQPIPPMQDIREENLSALKLVRTFDIPPMGSLYKIGFSPDGRILCLSYNLLNITGFDEMILWNIPDGRLLTTMAGGDFAFSPDGTRLAVYYYRDGATVLNTAYDDQAGFVLEVWDAPGGLPQTRLKTLLSVTAPLAFLPDGQSLIATGNSDLRIFRLSDWQMTASIRTAPYLVLSPDSASYMAITRGGTFYTDLRTGSALLPDAIEAAGWGVFSSDGSLYAAAAAWEKPVGVWNVHSGERISTILHLQITGGMSFSPDGSLLLIPGLDAFHLYRAADGERVRGIPLQVEQWGITPLVKGAISPDGKWIAVAYQTNPGESARVELWGVP